MFTRPAKLLILLTVLSGYPAGMLCHAQQTQPAAPVRYLLGDDTSGGLVWANQNFDDSGWQVATGGKLRLPSGSSGGYLWVRTSVVPRSDTSGPLAIRVTYSADALASEIYVNGQRIGQLGSLPPHARYAREAIFDLPADVASPGGSVPGNYVPGRPVMVALRTWYPPVAHDNFLEPGASTLPTVVVDGARNLRTSESADHANAMVAGAPALALNVAVLFLGAGLLVFWFRSRSRELLLCSGLIIGQTAYMIEQHLFAFGILPYPWLAHGLFVVASNVVTMYLFVEFLWAIYDLRPNLLKAVAIAALVSCNVTVATFVLVTRYSRLTTLAIKSYPFSLAAFNFTVAGVALWALLSKRQNKGIAAAYLVVPITALLLEFGLFSGLTIGPFYIGGFELAFLISELALFLMLSGQALKAWRSREDLRAEFDAAREVQERLVAPAADIPGFKIESAYAPAKDVGGDFFFVRAGNKGSSPADRDPDTRNPDSSAFIVIGDVSGKGLRAALTVSAIMGALRTMPDLSPAHVLADLNRGLVGQLGGGFVTCCAVTISADGTATFANAGHLQPYCTDTQSQTREIALDSGLPLGILANAIYTQTTISLQLNDRLTLISDGVLEAQSPTGELLGFERTAALSAKSASQIAVAAQQWGQEDDITVLTVRPVTR